MFSIQITSHANSHPSSALDTLPVPQAEPGVALSPRCHLTSTGFLRRIKKFSALIIIKRMNLWHKIFSISSAWREKREVRLPHRLSSQPPAQTPPHLLHCDADAHGVNRALDEDLLLLVPADDHRLQQQLFAAPANRGRAGVTQKEAFTGGKQGRAAVRITGMWGLCYRMFPRPEDAPPQGRHSLGPKLDPLPPPRSSPALFRPCA